MEYMSVIFFSDFLTRKNFLKFKKIKNSDFIQTNDIYIFTIIVYYINILDIKRY